MKKAQKIEIIIESVYLTHLVKILEKAIIPGYTIINGASGRGSHGIHDAQGFSDVSTNSYIIAICTENEIIKLIPLLRKELEKYGGICFLSDVSQIIIKK